MTFRTEIQFANHGQLDCTIETGRRVWIHNANIHGVAFCDLRDEIQRLTGCATIAWESKRRGWQRVVRQLNGVFREIPGGWTYEVPAYG